MLSSLKHSSLFLMLSWSRPIVSSCCGVVVNDCIKLVFVICWRGFENMDVHLVYLPFVFCRRQKLAKEHIRKYNRRLPKSTSAIVLSSASKSAH